MGSYMEYMYLENLSTRMSLDEKLNDIKQLGKLRSKVAIPKLTELAKNPDQTKQIRTTSILALIEIGDHSFLKEFVPFSEIEDQDILELLIIAIGKLHAIELLPEYSSFIDSKNKDLKLKILDILKGFEDIIAVKVLLEFVKDKDSEIRNIAKNILKESKTFQNYVTQLDETETLNVITLIPKREAEKLINKMIKETEDKRILKILISAIGDLKLEHSFNLLKNLYKVHDIKSLRLHIIDALNKTKDLRHKEFYLDLLNAPNINREIKAKLIFALEKYLDDRVVVEEIFEIIENSSQWWMLRKVSILVLSNNLNKKDLDRLLEILETEKDSRVIRTLIEVMGEAGVFEEEKYINIGRKYLDSESSSVKKVTILALSKLGDKSVLEILLRDEKLRIQMLPDSLKALTNFNDPRIIEILLDNLNSDDDELIKISINGLAQYNDKKIEEKLIRFIQKDDTKREYKTKLIMILSNYKTEKVSKLFKNILNDESAWWMLKKVVIIAIGEQENYNLIKSIIKHTKNLDSRISKNAKYVAKQFYTNKLLSEIKDKKNLYNFAKEYIEIFSS
ncbi:MAG: HEAT repeat domain-containing protein [Fusobacteriota bacterium]